MALIDIIVPVYKVEQFLRPCVDSILGQTFPDWHLILVDDGSPDTCGSICDEYASRDSRITVIHKENGGLSSARNAGLDIASGECVCFIDSDDTIHPQMLEKLYARLTECDADISLCSFCFVDEDGKPMDTQNGHSPVLLEEWPGCVGFEKLYQPDGYYFAIACCKLYRRTLFQGLRFPPGKLREDEAVVHYLYHRAKKVSCIPDELYYYRQRNGSIMSARNIKRDTDYLDALWDRAAFAKQNELTDFRDHTRMTIWHNTVALTVFRETHGDVYARYKKKLTGLVPWLCMTRLCNFRNTVRLLVWKLFDVELSREKLARIFHR